MKNGEILISPIRRYFDRAEAGVAMGVKEKSLNLAYYELPEEDCGRQVSRRISNSLCFNWTCRRNGQTLKRFIVYTILNMA